MSFINSALASEKSSVRVAVRVRPLNKKEEKSNSIIAISKGKVYITDPKSKEKKNFTYDYVYNDSQSQEDIYNDIGKQVISNAFRGYNSCVFAYGQTSSGKSHTMMGGSTTQKGLIPRICQNLFELQSTHGSVEQGNCDITYQIEVSYMEIYSEQVKDLLNPSANDKSSLVVRQHPEFGPYVEGLTQILVEDYSSIKRIMSKGNKERHIASTNMNDRSSRSHAILTVYFTQIVHDPDLSKPREIVSKINLVDLAGSERVEASGVTGVNFKEAVMINKSLSTLGLVISKLVAQNSMTKSKLKSKHKSNTPVTSVRSVTSPKSIKKSSSSSPSVDIHIPFRDSILTWILKESLGGNSKTYMIATLSPSSDNYSETLSTLRYAYNAKQIVNTVKINEDPNDKIIRVLRGEINALKSKLQNSKSINSQSLEVVELQQELEQRQSLMREREKSWTEKLKESRDMNDRIKLQMKEQLALTEKAHAEELKKLNEDRDKLLQEVDKMRKEVNSHPSDDKKKSFVETVVRLQEHYEKRMSMLRNEHDQASSEHNSNSDATRHLNTLQEEYKILKSDYDALREEKSNLLREHTDLRVACTKLQADKEKSELTERFIQNEKQKLSENLEALRVDLKNLEQSTHTLSHKNNELEEQIKQLTVVNSTLQEQHQQATKKITAMSSTEIQLRKELSRDKSHIEIGDAKWNGERNRRIKHVQQLQARVAVLENRIKANIAEMPREEQLRYETLQKECEGLQLQINHDRESVRKLQQHSDTLRESIEQQQERLSNMISEQHELDQKLNASRAIYNDLEKQKEFTRQHIKKLSEDIELHIAQALVLLKNPSDKVLEQIRDTITKLLNHTKNTININD